MKEGKHADSMTDIAEEEFAKGRRVSNTLITNMNETHHEENPITLRKSNFSILIEMVPSFSCTISLFLIGSCVGLGGNTYLILILLGVMFMGIASISFMFGIKTWKEDNFFQEEIQLENGLYSFNKQKEIFQLQENSLVHI